MSYEQLRFVQRYISIVDIELVELHSGIQVRGRTTTLGLFGCGVKASLSFPKGTSLWIKLSRAGIDVEAFGRVVYVNTDLAMGIVFTSIEQESERILDGWVAELAAVPI